MLDLVIFCTHSWKLTNVANLPSNHGSHLSKKMALSKLLPRLPIFYCKYPIVDLPDLVCLGSPRDSNYSPVKTLSIAQDLSWVKDSFNRRKHQCQPSNPKSSSIRIASFDTQAKHTWTQLRKGRVNLYPYIKQRRNSARHVSYNHILNHTNI